MSIADRQEGATPCLEAPRKPDPLDPTAWEIALENRGLLLSYLRRRLPWALAPDLAEDAIQIGTILAAQAVQKFDPTKTTLGGWIVRYFDAQLKWRIREFQGLSDAPAEAPLPIDGALDTTGANERIGLRVQCERGVTMQSLKRQIVSLMRRKGGTWSVRRIQTQVVRRDHVVRVAVDALVKEGVIGIDADAEKTRRPALYLSGHTEAGRLGCAE